MASLDSIGISDACPKIRFKAIKEFPGYYVSSDGHVWTTFRRVYKKGNNRCGVAYVADGAWHRLKANNTGNGYQDVQLRRNGVVYHRLIHRLVLSAFRGSPPQPGMECAHNNSNPTDNRLKNLRWDTKAGNQADRLSRGTDSRGEKHGGAKATNAMVREICHRLLAGERPTHLAKEYGMQRETIGKIRLGKAWKHIWEEVNAAHRLHKSDNS